MSEKFRVVHCPVLHQQQQTNQNGLKLAVNIKLKPLIYCRTVKQNIHLKSEQTSTKEFNNCTLS